jgi:hypothetical protein
VAIEFSAGRHQVHPQGDARPPIMERDAPFHDYGQEKL